jgi:hypothetical protein
VSKKKQSRHGQGAFCLRVKKYIEKSKAAPLTAQSMAGEHVEQHFLLFLEPKEGGRV